MTLVLEKRFTQTDPLAADLGSPYPSAYVYGNNNPVRFVDPTGLRGELAFANGDPLLLVSDSGGGPGDAKASFSIPKWKGMGRTRMNFFIADDLSCFGMCLEGDQDVSSKYGKQARPVDNPYPSSRARIVLDHENGRGYVTVSHSTAVLPAQGATIAQRPVSVYSQKAFSQPPEGGDSNYVNTVQGLADVGSSELVLQYRLLDSFVPQGVGGAAPAVDGVLRFGRAGGNNLKVQGWVERYPSMEIIRESSNGSVRVYGEGQSGGPGLGLFRKRNVAPMTCSFVGCVQS
jgi:hypothetical protein